jgi:hypothetical protein
LIAAKELLTDTGSIFVQIGDENVHRRGSMSGGYVTNHITISQPSGWPFLYVEDSIGRGGAI